MKLTKLFLIFFSIFQLTVSVNARDDLVVNKEMSVLSNFTKGYGGVCFYAAESVQSVAGNIKLACESLFTKASKATRHCATAADNQHCIETILDENSDKVIEYLRCCVSLQKSGKMK